MKNCNEICMQTQIEIERMSVNNATLTTNMRHRDELRANRVSVIQFTPIKTSHAHEWCILSVCTHVNKNVNTVPKTELIFLIFVIN